MKVSISRSVGRTFAIIEIFKQIRQPASATQLRRLLEAPHSSVVAVLQNLLDLGYLSFDPSDMTYFPTTKLLDLTGWLRQAPADHGRLGALAELVSRDTRHMTALSCRVSLFVNTIVLRAGRFPAVTGPARGVGAALTASMPGLAILAQLDDAEVHGILRDTEAWLKEAGASTLASIEAMRRRGWASGAHPICRSTEIIAYPVKAADGAAFALSVHLPTFLSPDAKAEVRQLVEARIRACDAAAARLPATGPNPPAGQAARRPGGRLPDFGARIAPQGRDTMPHSRLLTAQRDAG
jgi:DNA-binding IclR family transcriptional regulator